MGSPQDEDPQADQMQGLWAMARLDSQESRKGATMKNNTPNRELLPCPFCGSSNLTLDNLTELDDFFIECEGCQIQQIANYTRDEAIRRWNYRLLVPPAAPSEPVERCSDCPRLYDTEGPVCDDCPPLESGKAAPPAPAEEQRGIYFASRASIPARAQKWRDIRASGVAVSCTWIDEDGEGQTGDFGELWKRIQDEVTGSASLILYAEPEDFPLKGALIEVGMALAAGVPVFAVLPGVALEPRSMRPVGSWLKHSGVTVVGSVDEAVHLSRSDLRVSLPSPQPVEGAALNEVEEL
jgi:Lar family restriction alleviation protein